MAETLLTENRKKNIFKEYKKKHVHLVKLLIFANKGVCVRVAQWIARRTSNPEVVGSNPTVDVFFVDVFVYLNHVIIK